MKLDFQNEMMGLIQQERNTIFSNIHDTFGGYLEALKLRLLQRKENDSPEEVQELLNSFYKEYRFLLNSLYAPKINSSNFQESLSAFCSRIDSLTDSQIHTQFEIDNIKLSEELYVHLYRMTSELLMNAVKHSKASVIQVLFTKTPNDYLQLVIQDDGIGFDWENIRREAHGLRNIKERVQRVSGEFDLKTKYDVGTTITIAIPLHND
jgi:signal transduction histidine kinase